MFFNSPSVVPYSFISACISCSCPPFIMMCPSPTPPSFWLNVWLFGGWCISSATDRWVQIKGAHSKIRGYVCVVTSHFLPLTDWPVIQWPMHVLSYLRRRSCLKVRKYQGDRNEMLFVFEESTLLGLISNCHFCSDLQHDENSCIVLLHLNRLMAFSLMRWYAFRFSLESDPAIVLDNPQTTIL